MFDNHFEVNGCLNLANDEIDNNFSYMHLIAKHSLGGAPYFLSMAMSNVLLEVSKALNRSTNTTHFGRLWLCLICRSVLIMNVPYVGVDVLDG